MEIDEHRIKADIPPSVRTGSRVCLASQGEPGLNSGQAGDLDLLDVDKAAAETILRLRSQIIGLQSHIRQLEAELTVQNASQQLRLARYWKVYYEATWIELEFQE